MNKTPQARVTGATQLCKLQKTQESNPSNMLQRKGKSFHHAHLGVAPSQTAKCELDPEQQQNSSCPVVTEFCYLSPAGAVSEAPSDPRLIQIPTRCHTKTSRLLHQYKQRSSTLTEFIRIMPRSITHDFLKYELVSKGWPAKKLRQQPLSCAVTRRLIVHSLAKCTPEALNLGRFSWSRISREANHTGVINALMRKEPEEPRHYQLLPPPSPCTKVNQPWQERRPPININCMLLQED